MFEILKIIALSVSAAVTYGIVHDQITARLCVEYFTVAHPPVFATQSPTLLAFGWGVIATWWVGMLLGVPAACLARFGGWPKVSAGDLRRPIAVLLLVMGSAAAAAGWQVYSAAEAGRSGLGGAYAQLIPAEKHSRFLADAAAHATSYGVGFLGGVVLWINILWRRWRRAANSPQEPSTAPGETANAPRATSSSGPRPDATGA